MRLLWSNLGQRGSDGKSWRSCMSQEQVALFDTVLSLERGQGNWSLWQSFSSGQLFYPAAARFPARLAFSSTGSCSCLAFITSCVASLFAWSYYYSRRRSVCRECLGVGSALACRLTTNQILERATVCSEELWLALHDGPMIQLKKLVGKREGEGKS